MNYFNLPFSIATKQIRLCAIIYFEGKRGKEAHVYSITPNLERQKIRAI
jgi:hypothetical protein